MIMVFLQFYAHNNTTHNVILILHFRVCLVPIARFMKKKIIFHTFPFLGRVLCVGVRVCVSGIFVNVTLYGEAK